MATLLGIFFFSSQSNEGPNVAAKIRDTKSKQLYPKQDKENQPQINSKHFNNA